MQQQQPVFLRTVTTFPSTVHCPTSEPRNTETDRSHNNDNNNININNPIWTTAANRIIKITFITTQDSSNW